MNKEPIPKDHENKEICSQCNDCCCKCSACELFPEDLGKVTAKKIIKKIQDGYCFDYWDGNPTTDKRYSKLTAYYMRPSHKGDEEMIVDSSWGGECVFLTESGCSLSEPDRPSGGKAMIPNKDSKKCHQMKGYTKHDCAIAWLPYNDLINNIIKKIKIERVRLRQNGICVGRGIVR